MTAAPRFDGRTALVTGAASGIGRATAYRFAAEGGTPVIADLYSDGEKDIIVPTFFRFLEVLDGNVLSFL